MITYLFIFIVLEGADGKVALGVVEVSIIILTNSITARQLSNFIFILLI